jgi:excisionase family DNA binding protein
MVMTEAIAKNNPGCSPNCVARHNPSTAASILGVSRRTVCRLMIEGELRYEKRRGGQLIEHGELLRYQNERSRVA